MLAPGPKKGDEVGSYRKTRRMLSRLFAAFLSVYLNGRVMIYPENRVTGTEPA